MLPSPLKSVLSCTDGFRVWAPLGVHDIEGSPTDASDLFTSK